mgnify:CR=1 FL=1
MIVPIFGIYFLLRFVQISDKARQALWERRPRRDCSRQYRGEDAAPTGKLRGCAASGR